MVNDCPLTTIASDREGPMFFSTANPISPAPVPDFDLNATQDSARSTDHGQPALTLTLKTKEPPSAGNDADAGLSEREQRVSTPASCETEMTSLPTFTAPDL